MLPLPRQRWLRLSLLHPAASALLLLVSLIPPIHTPFDAILYLDTLAFFVINLPGVALLQDTAPWIDWNATQTLSLILMVFLTWLIVVLPVCMLISHARQRKALAKQQSRP